MLTSGTHVVEWMAKQLKCTFGVCQGIGWMKDGEIVAGIVFDGYNQANIFVHIAKLRGERMPPTLIAAMFDYPFRQLQCKRLSAIISDRNEASMGFARKLGATVNGFLEDGAVDGNLVIFGLLRKDANKWLTKSLQRRLGVEHGRHPHRVGCHS